ncbi:MAG: YceI family protein [Pseudorhodobacter sp.]|nr:YceI family protein [Pseudorhodobacter sp.]
MPFNRITLLAVLATLTLALAGVAAASPVRYALDASASVVGFETDFGPDRITGRMPVTRADLSLDFARVANSTVAVTLDASAAQASFPFAAQAMRGPKVLDAANHPQITFQSTSVKTAGDGARVDGQLTIRGETRPMVLRAMIWRKQGSQADDLSHLVIRLTGAVNRSAFGATGWSDMVGDEVRLDILARIAQVP